ncbi:MAG: hypothetical protein WBB36_08530 [Chitinophagales bacterium]
MADITKLKNPFVGLRAFEENENYLFFGRSAEINDLLKKFAASRFLAVIGSSGSGKSSLVKSGLLPAVYSGFLSVGTNWRVVTFRPGNDPIGNMSKELAREGVLYEEVAASRIPYQPIIESTLRRSGGGLIQAYRQAHLAPTENLLVVVDQFEELFRFSRYEAEANDGKSDALNFVNLLLTAAQQQDFPVYVLLTMRSDFLGDCAQFRGLPEAINAGQYLVPRMTREEIREAITGPIAVGGAQIAPRLVTRVLNDVGNNLDQLPILQHAMMRTWDTWQMKNQPTVPIDLPDYEKIGTMSKALSQHAEEAFAELKTEKQQLTCELMFKALTDKAADVRGTRRPTSVEDLCTLTNSNVDEVINIVEVFRKPGRTFLMPPPDVALSEKSIIDISHESIMRVWERLTKWTDEEAMSAEVYLRLSAAAQLYEEGKTDLWRNPELEIGLKWYRANQPTALWADRYDNNFEKAKAFLFKSEEEAIALQKEKERAARNRRRLAAGAIIFFALLAVASFATMVYVNGQRKIAVTERAKADTARMVADSAKIEADSQRQIAESQKEIADSQKQVAESQKEIADSLKDIAILEKQRAVTARKDAETQRNIAENLLEQTLKQNRRIAASEYQKLIREGPTDEDSINNGWNYKYYSYWWHLVNLQEDPNNKADVRNDELYDKLYYSLILGNYKNDSKKENKDYVMDKINDGGPTGYVAEKYSLGNGHDVTISNDKLQVLYNGNSELMPRRISALAVDSADKMLLIATEDNVLTVEMLNSQYQQVNKYKIPMGGQVTALDYDAGSDVIFFGLLTGEIGYINFIKDSRNQPVYKNQLDSKVTAIDFFMREKNKACYLLATSIRGQAIVYEVGSTPEKLADFLRANKKLSGIELPENIGDIKFAKYLTKHKSTENRVELVTVKNTSYLWNPFVDELLAELDAHLDPLVLADSTAKTKYYK